MEMQSGVPEGSGACLRPRCLAFCANANCSRLHLQRFVDPAESLLTRLGVVRQMGLLVVWKTR
jgi:hypothetical protein